jgi:hypothetical protein
MEEEREKEKVGMKRGIRKGGDEKRLEMRRGDGGIRRKAVVKEIQQWREEDELGRGDGRNQKEDGSGRNTTGEKKMS